MKISQSIAVLFLSAAVFTSCNDDKDNAENLVNANIKLENLSKEPAFAFGMPGFGPRLAAAGVRHGDAQNYSGTTGNPRLGDLP